MRTLSVRVGTGQVFWACIALLEAAYLGALGVGMASSSAWRRVAITLSHAALATWLYWRARQTDLSDSKAIYRCYMDVWKVGGGGGGGGLLPGKPAGDGPDP